METPSPNKSARGKVGPLHIEDLFVGDQYAQVREDLATRGVYVDKKSGKEIHAQVEKTADGKHKLMSIAAITRDPGRTQDTIDGITDFDASNAVQNIPLNPTRVRQYLAIYRNDGMTNNAVNKLAALIGGTGRFKVRKARRGRQRNPTNDLQVVLDHFTRYVNNTALDGVVTNDRGLKALIRNAARQLFVEADWIGRTIWKDVEVPGLTGRYSLPMTIQSVSMLNLEPVRGLRGIGELWYWKPDTEFLRLARDKKLDPLIKKVIDEVIDPKTLDTITKNNRILLDPALLMHVRHRGLPTDTFGESLIEPAKLALRYSRALISSDLVTMENVINRLTIVQVGTSDPKSPYSKKETAAARAALMQRFFENLAPSMVIVWQGDDVKVEEVGAQDSLLDMSDRFATAERMQKLAFGLPDALLVGGSGSDAQSGWASVIGAAAQMQEVLDSFESVLSTLSERIAWENGYEDYETIWEFDRSALTDAMAERVQNRADYVTGLASIRTAIAGAGRDPDAEFEQRCIERGLDPLTATWEQAFAPPQGLQGQGGAAPQGQGEGKVPGEGRTPDQQQPDTSP